MKNRKYLNLIKISGSLVSLILFIYLITRQDWNTLISLISQIPILGLGGVLIFYFSSAVLNGFRWYELVKIVNIEISLQEIIKINFVGMFVSNFLPSTIGGDSVRLINLLRYDQRKRTCLATIILDRLLNLVIMLFIVPFAIISYWPETKNLLNQYINTSNELITREVRYLQFGFLYVLFEKINNQIKDMYSLLQEYLKKPKHTGLALIFAVFALLFSYGGTYLLTVILNMQVGFIDVIKIASIVYFFSLIPISFNGLGVRELIMTNLYVSMGSSFESATILAIISRLLMVIVSTAGAIWLPNYLLRVKDEE